MPVSNKAGILDDERRLSGFSSNANLLSGLERKPPSISRQGCCRIRLSARSVRYSICQFPEAPLTSERVKTRVAGQEHREERRAFPKSCGEPFESRLLLSHADVNEGDGCSGTVVRDPAAFQLFPDGLSCGRERRAASDTAATSPRRTREARFCSGSGLPVPGGGAGFDRSCRTGPGGHP